MISKAGFDSQHVALWILNCDLTLISIESHMILFKLKNHNIINFNPSKFSTILAFAG